MYNWDTNMSRKHVSIIQGVESPTIVLKNVTYLNSVLKTWLTSHIWISGNRIIYVGDKLPSNLNNTEVLDCSNKYAVPGYIEPHAHPFQLYNPLSFGHYASVRGTTTIVSDNLLLLLLFSQKKAMEFIMSLKDEPVSFYWWSRYDSQTLLHNEAELFSEQNMKEWLSHELVLQGGELTCWPAVLSDDDADEILSSMIETKALGKPIEGHLPGASSKTLTMLALLGVNSDHEAMSGKDVYERLRLGYSVSLRYSSIRPDLPNLLTEMVEMGLRHYDKVMFTTDGSTPAFYKQGMIEKMISIALEKGIPTEEAYNMASYNAARHLKIDDIHGMIAPGQIANINILNRKEDPLPNGVLANGTWMKKNGKVNNKKSQYDWTNVGILPLDLDWDLQESDFDFTGAIGMEMINSVIMKPYTVKEVNQLDEKENYLILIDRNGKWRVNTILKNFAINVNGFASSYSNSGDIILIGNDIKSMKDAFTRLKEIGGGITLCDSNHVIYELPLQMAGAFSDQPLEILIEENKNLIRLLNDRGYNFEDPIYTLLFLSSIHLPYVRITPMGIYDVMQKTILNPAKIR